MPPAPDLCLVLSLPHLLLCLLRLMMGLPRVKECLLRLMLCLVWVIAALDLWWG